MSPRTGRPTKEPKSNKKTYRLSDEDMKKLEFCVEKTGLSATDIVRRGIDLVYQETIKK